MTDTLFSSLQLPAAQLDNLQRLGYHTMTPIQAASLPLAMSGNDLIGQAATGSGKTAAFALPLLNRLNPRDFGAQALVLCPTRELATQVATEIRRLARYQQNIKVVTLCGGQPIGPQIGSLEHGAHVIVGTPGRITDHLRKKTLDLARVNCVVLDEADRMLEMGFVDDMEDIIRHTPTRRQTLLFSATFPPDIETLSAQFQTTPQRITIDSGQSSAAIDQRFFICSADNRSAGLARLLAHFQPESAVVFCNTRQLVDELAGFLRQQGMSAAALHGDMEQRDRDRVLVRFRQQSCSLLVATDVAARGLDIDDLPAVVNFELPRSPEVYVHRIGRTGRIGKKGLALSLITEKERHHLARIEEFQDRQANLEAVEELPQNSEPFHPPPYVTLEVAGGRKNKIRPGDLLGALTGEAGIAGSAVGKIDVMDRASFVAVASGVADKALGRLINGRIKGRQFKVRKL